MSVIEKIWSILQQVPDPEVPVLTITDLGIVRDVREENGGIAIDITPTYTGCPAMDMISMNIKLAMQEAGYRNYKVNLVLHPTWTTDWMTENGKQKLKAYGIAPPNPKMEIPEDGVECPQCNSLDTQLISTFGSTACKALYKCLSCKEPFDYFKCH